MCMSLKGGGGEKLNENEAADHEKWFYSGLDFSPAFFIPPLRTAIHNESE